MNELQDHSARQFSSFLWDGHGGHLIVIGRRDAHFVFLRHRGDALVLLVILGGSSMQQRALRTWPGL